MKELAADFHKLEQRLVLQGVITTRTALRIGSSGTGETDAVDLPVLRDGDGFPLIPGSSLKGAFRSTLESLVRGARLPRDTGIWTCNPFLEGEEPNPERACGYHAPGQRKKVDLESHCALCRLLGSKVLASHVRFSDAMLLISEDENDRSMPIETRDGVAIDRDLRVAFGGQKYDFEVVSPGTRFNLEVFVENPKDWLMGLLVVGFEQIAEGFTALGGFTSRGLGRVELEWLHMTRVTAKDLLMGSPPERIPAAKLEAQFDFWRQALGTKARGGV